MFNILIFGGLNACELSLIEEIIYRLDVKPAIINFLNCLEPSTKKQGSLMNLEDLIFKERVEKMALFQDRLRTTHVKVTGKVRYGYCKPNFIDYIKREKPQVVIYLGDIEAIKANYFTYQKEDLSFYYSQDVSILIDASVSNLDNTKTEETDHTTVKLKKQEVTSLINLLKKGKIKIQ